MTSARNASLVLLVGLHLVSSCYVGEPLEVLHTSPTGELGAPPSWFEVRFDKPIVDPDMSAPAAHGLDIRIAPPIAGEVAFPTPSSLTYAFTDTVPPAHSYTVTVGAGLRSADGKAVLKSDVSFTFNSGRNRVDRLYQLEATVDSSGEFPNEGSNRTTNLGLHDKLLLALHYPEQVARLRKLVSVKGEPMAGGEARDLDFRLAFPADDVADRAIVAPAGNWPKHTHLRVHVGAGLEVASEGAGPLASVEDQVLTASTYGPIKVANGPACNMCRPPPTLTFEFSTPVECEDVLPFVRLRPEPDTLRCAGQPTPTAVRIEPLPALAAYTKYEIVVRPGVVDAFGQELSAKAAFELETGDANPRFAHQLMFNVLERKLGAVHEEKVWKTPKLEVVGARLPFAEAWRIIASQGLSDQVAWSQLPWWLSGTYYDYDCYWDDETGQEICGSNRRHPGATETADIPIPNAVTRQIQTDDTEGWSVVQIGLDPFLEGKGGIVVVKSTPLSEKGNRLSNPVLRLLNVTDIGLSAKYSPSQLVVLATNLSDGKAIPGAEVAVYTVSAKQGEALGDPAATGKTDEQGVVVFAAAELTGAGEQPNLQARGLFVTASEGDDEAFIWSKFESGGQRASDDGPSLVGKVYTERGVYRPGEKVYYRAVMRKQVAQGFSTPTGEAEIRAKRGSYWYYDDDSDDEIYSTNATVSEFGTLSGSFAIPADARIGDYGIAAEIDDQKVTGTFKVAEFRRAEMKVTVNTDETEYIRGQEMQVRVNADYLFGAPAAGLDMRWSLRRSWGYFDSKRFPNARFSDYDYHSWYDDSDDYSEFVDQGTVTLDDNGSFEMERRLKQAGGRGKIENLVVSATVDDESGQSVSARRTVRVHPASFHVGLIPHGYLKEKDKVFTFEAVAVSPKDEAVGGVDLKVSSHQEYWYSIKRKGPGGRMIWDYRREVVDEKDVCNGTTDENGRLTCQLTPRKGGSLKLRVTGKDKQNRTVRASSWFWITGDPEYYGGRSDGGNQVGLMAESPEVDVGTPARIAVTSPFREAIAMVTVEREDILWRKVMPIGSNGVVDIPVQPSWAPNVYVSATVVRGRVTPEGEMKPDPERDKPAYALGYLNLQVRPSRNVLAVDVATDKKKYEPGQKVTANVEVKDYAGSPVEAEVNLYAVDEGVLMLTAYETPDLIPALFRERPYAVVALDTRMHVLGKRHFITPIIKGEDSGGGGGGEEEGEALRKDFNPVATWIGDLATDSSGKASHTFELPDTLTTYRVMAVAVSNRDAFGSGDTELKVNKTLMMRQAMPRFARPADSMQAGVVVNQLSGKAGTVTVQIEKIDEKLFKVGGKRTLTQQVGAKETVAFRWQLEAADAEGASEIIFSAEMGKFRDRVQLLLPVRRLQPRESISVAGVLEPGKLSHTLAVPAGARTTDLEVNMSGLPVASLEEKVRQLVGYPYGCLEQRTSKIMPLIAIRELSKQLEFSSVPTDKIRGWVEEWVGLVPKYRCQDDGFDYYPGCRSGSDPYLTAFALDGLLTARKFGYTVPDGVIDPAAGYLESRLTKMEDGSSWDHNASGMAGALRVLAALGRSKPSFENTLYEGRAKLPLFARTDLTRAIFARTKAKSGQVDTLMKEMLQTAVSTKGVVTFKADDPDRYWWAWDSDLRSTALVLRTMLEVEPADARIPLVVRGLIDLDNRDSYYTTQGVTQTLLALADAVERIKVMGQKPVATVAVNGKPLMSEKPVGTALEQEKLLAAALGEPPYEVEIANTGSGPLYFGGYLHYAYPATARLPATSEGFRIERAYRDRNGQPISNSVTAGDFVEVELQIWIDEDGRMVVVDDPLPAGLEPVDTTLETSDTEMAKVVEGRSGDWSWWRSRYKEMRDDRTEWHFRRLWKSWRNRPIKLRYLTRAVTPGTYYAPGTSVERMYQPEIRGRGKGRTLTVLPKQK